LPESTMFFFRLPSY